MNVDWNKKEVAPQPLLFLRTLIHGVQLNT